MLPSPHTSRLLEPLLRDILAWHGSRHVTTIQADGWHPLLLRAGATRLTPVTDRASATTLGDEAGLLVVDDRGLSDAQRAQGAWPRCPVVLLTPGTALAPRLLAAGYGHVLAVWDRGTVTTMELTREVTADRPASVRILLRDDAFVALAPAVYRAMAAAQDALVSRLAARTPNASAACSGADPAEASGFHNAVNRVVSPADAAARLAVLAEQEQALESYLRLRRDEGPWASVTPRLGVLFQHEPIPLAVPSHYTDVPRLTCPPAISIVTPSLNAAPFLAETLGSVLDQGYPRLEYVVQDGGSTDGSLDLLERYRPSLAAVASECDSGMAQAINRGLRQTHGEIMAYLNADDLLLPGALHTVAAYFSRHPEVDVVYGHRVLVDADTQEVGRWVLPPHDDDVLSWADYIPQETLFWRRALWERAGGAMDETFRFAVDWDLLLRFRAVGAQMRRLPRFLGAFRVHPAQKTSREIEDAGSREMRRLRERVHGQDVSGTTIISGLSAYIAKHKVYQRLYELGVLRY